MSHTRRVFSSVALSPPHPEPAIEPIEITLAEAVEKFSETLLSNKPAQRLSDFIDPETFAAMTVELPSVESDDRTLDAVGQALRHHDQLVKNALHDAGLSTAIVDLVQSLVTMHVDARTMETRLQLRRLLDASQLGIDPLIVQPGQVAGSAADPFAPLSAAELGKQLGGRSDETVRQREKAGELFSLLRPGRKRGREYPAFQAWPNVAGAPLAEILRTLGDANGASAYGFFSSPSPELGRLTPVEVLTGKLIKVRSIDASAAGLLVDTPQARLDAVVSAAGAYAADLAA